MVPQNNMPYSAHPTSTLALSLPLSVGVGLRSNHHHDILTMHKQLAWIEVHSENFFGGGESVSLLKEVREHLPVSLHGVGLSLGSATGVDRYHLTRLKQLSDNIQPYQISDHVAWNMNQGIHHNDLLPLPYTEESLAVICRNIDHVQDVLQRPILVENPSTYLQYGHSTIPETTFLEEIVQRTGCGLLLDINNVYVNSQNHQFDPYDYVRHISPEHIHEIHLAGHTKREDISLLIDTHEGTVCDAVMDLYGFTIQTCGMRPTLIEWDTHTPPLSTLVHEAKRIEAYAMKHLEQEKLLEEAI